MYSQYERKKERKKERKNQNNFKSTVVRITPATKQEKEKKKILKTKQLLLKKVMNSTAVCFFLFAYFIFV